MLTLRELTADLDVRAAYSLMAELRPALAAAEFVATVAAQRVGGYRLYGGFVEREASGGDLVALAGIREARTLARGPHLFVDDLVVRGDCRGIGVGRATLQWLRRHAAARGLPAVYLDSRDTAREFYRREGFSFLTSVPCWITAAR